MSAIDGGVRPAAAGGARFVYRLGGPEAATPAGAGLVTVSPAVGELPVVDEIALRTVPRWHFAMLNDTERNDALAVALERTIRPGAHVLDIGSGTGLLAMMAVRAGAASVTTCESHPLLAEISRAIVRAHGLSDIVSVVAKPSTELEVGRDLPARADVIVAEVVDCGLVGEGILPTIRDARERLLAERGRLVPQAARLLVRLVESVAADRLNNVQTVHGFDLRLFNRLATPGHFPIRLHTWPHRLLSEPVELARFDFVAGQLDETHRSVALPVNADGVAHGAVAWFELDLGAGVVLRNSPDNVGSHWMQAFVSLAKPMHVHRGQSVELHFSWPHGRIRAQAPIPSDTKGSQT
jgi:precorrin-6B methylase 2